MPSRTATSDRTSRLFSRSFEYRHPERLELARAVLEAMQALKDQEGGRRGLRGPRTRHVPPRAREGAASTVWRASRWWAAGRSRSSPATWTTARDRQGRAHYVRSAWAPSTAAASGDTWRS